MQYNTIEFKVKNAKGTAVTLQSAMGKFSQFSSVQPLIALVD